jgi:hypothetical protein
MSTPLKRGEMMMVDEMQKNIGAATGNMGTQPDAPPKMQFHGHRNPMSSSLMRRLSGRISMSGFTPIWRTPKK